jgi:hypothetical protein
VQRFNAAISVQTNHQNLFSSEFSSIRRHIWTTIQFESFQQTSWRCVASVFSEGFVDNICEHIVMQWSQTSKAYLDPEHLIRPLLEVQKEAIISSDIVVGEVL